jgi:hypothetical protein
LKRQRPETRQNGLMIGALVTDAPGIAKYLSEV